MVRHCLSNFWLALEITIQSWSPGEFLPLRACFVHNRRMNNIPAPEDGEGLVNARETIIGFPSYLFI